MFVIEKERVLYRVLGNFWSEIYVKLPLILFLKKFFRFFFSYFFCLRYYVRKNIFSLQSLDILSIWPFKLPVQLQFFEKQTDQKMAWW